MLRRAADITLLGAVSFLYSMAVFALKLRRRATARAPETEPEAPDAA